MKCVFKLAGGLRNRAFKSLSISGGEIPVVDSSLSSALIHGIHVFHCPDEVGIVAKLSDCIASRGGNILAADIFVPHKKQVFYSRSEFVFDPAKWPRVQMDEDFLKLSTMFKAIKSVVRVPDLDPRHKIVVLASKQDHCLVDLLHGWQDGRLPVHIKCVISNHDRGPNTHVMRFLQRHGIPYHYLGTTKEGKREEEILDLVQDTDFIVLARYMQNEISASTIKETQMPLGQFMMSEHPPCSGVNSSFFPISEGNAIEKSMEVDSQPNWGWHIQGPCGGETPVPLFSTAASSGFTTSNTTASSVAVYQPHFTLPHHHYAISVTNANNISCYYSRC